MESFLEQVVADYMTRDVKTVTRGLTLRELGGLFEREDFNTYPVKENGQVAGMVSKFDHLACFVFTPAHMMPNYDDLNGPEEFLDKQTLPVKKVLATNEVSIPADAKADAPTILLLAPAELKKK